MRALSINRATQLVSCVTVLCWLVCCWLIRVCSCVYLFSLVYIISIYSTVLSDSPSMADTPRELDWVNGILITDDVLATGPRTPWSPIRGLMGRRPGRLQPPACSTLRMRDSSGRRSVAGEAVRQMKKRNAIQWNNYMYSIWASLPMSALRRAQRANPFHVEPICTMRCQFWEHSRADPTLWQLLDVSQHQLLIFSVRPC